MSPLPSGLRPAVHTTLAAALVLGSVGPSQANAQGLPNDPDVVDRLATEASEHPLPLEHVLESVATHHPRIDAAVERTRQADGERLASEGGFDPRIEGQVMGLTGGYYDLLRADVGVRQPTSLWGAQFYAGYRVGLGLDPEQRFPTYYPDETLSGGEVRAGVEVPLWRDGPIDATRARIQKAGHGVQAAASALYAQDFDLRVMAASAYYRWVAAGHRLRIAERLLALARRRGELLEGRHAAGAVPEFDISDNLRMVYDRSDSLVAVRRSFEAASIDLSLYLRDESSTPIIPTMSRLPPMDVFERTDLVDAGDVFRAVVTCHPRLRQMRAELAAVGVDVDLAENQVAPDVRAMFGVSRDIGDPDRDVTLPGTVVELGLRLSLPVLLRTSRGEASAARAALREKEAELRWLEDQLVASVHNAKSALDASLERVEMTSQLVSVSEAVAGGERQRFDAGASTLLAVNLREQAAADAARRYIDAVAAADIARFQWNATGGLSCDDS